MSRKSWDFPLQSFQESSSLIYSRLLRNIWSTFSSWHPYWLFEGCWILRELTAHRRTWHAPSKDYFDLSKILWLSLSQHEVVEVGLAFDMEGVEVSSLPKEQVEVGWFRWNEGSTPSSHQMTLTCSHLILAFCSCLQYHLRPRLPLLQLFHSTFYQGQILCRISKNLS